MRQSIPSTGHTEAPLGAITRPLLGFLVAATVIGLFGLPLILGLHEGDRDLGVATAIVLFGLISGFLVARRPQHPISWLLAGIGLTGGIAGLSANFLPAGLVDPTWWQQVLLSLGGPSWFLFLFMVLVLIPLLFPTGSPPSPRWRWVGWLVGASVAAFSLLYIFQEEFCTDISNDLCISTVPNPIGISGVTDPERSAVGDLLTMPVVFGFLAAMVSLVVRYRRSGPVERQQIKWVASSLALIIASIVVVDIVWVESLGRAEPPGWRILQGLQWVLIPSSIAVAILRYRLYDIDRIISRTVTYGVVVGLLAAVYATGVFAVQAISPASDNLGIATSTLAAAALFAPLLRRVQKWVDRRFDRRRYDAQRVVEEFAHRLRTEVNMRDLSRNLQTVVVETMQPVAMSIWLPEGDLE